MLHEAISPLRKMKILKIKIFSFLELLFCKLQDSAQIPGLAGVSGAVASKNASGVDSSWWISLDSIPG